MPRIWLSLAALVMMLLAPLPARAQSLAEFYAGKTISMMIGYETGGSYDLYARAVARHIVKHIPGNPRSVPQNMVGASSMVLSNHLAKVAARDGTIIGAINPALLFDSIYSADSKAQFKGTDMIMIGNVVSTAPVLVALDTTGINRLDDLRSKELIVGATAVSGDTYLLPLAVKNALGLTGMRLITGYAGTREAVLALERGEITGRAWSMDSIMVTRPDWVSSGKLKLLALIAPRRHPDVPASVPLVKDFVTSEDDKRVLDVIFLQTLYARPYVSPPAVPADRVKALQDAFVATTKDAEFLEELKKLKLPMDATSGPDLEKVVRDAHALPPTLIERVRKLLKE